MDHPKKLLVEGSADKRVIPYLMEANGVTWKIDDQHVVHIEPHGGIDELLKPGVIGAELRASELEALGVLVDANGDAQLRWDQIKNRIREQPGAFYVMDRAYVDFKRLYTLHMGGAFFIVRAKSNLRYRRCDSRRVDKSAGLRSPICPTRFQKTD